jgi:hypothetical protein
MTGVSVAPQSALGARAGGVPVWIELEPQPVHAVLHSPEAGARRDTAVLILPPFGWDEATSYRARREWALALAHAGYTAARIDLPGTEDSVGVSSDAGRLTAWLDATAAAAAWLREQSGAVRVAAIGIGLGGLLAVESAAAGAAIDDLILWAVPARGRAHVRELRAYAGVIAAGLPEEPADPGARDGGVRHAGAADGAIGLAGYRMSAETVSALERIDLRTVSLPAGEDRRVLMIERDARGVDAGLQEAMQRSGASVTVLPASDYELLMAHPQSAGVPRASITGSIAWLDAAELAGEASSATVPVTEPPSSSESIAFRYRGTAVRETMIGYDTAEGRSVGILTEPAAGERAPFCVVMVNPGALRRTGPNRMWTELARRSASRGIPSVRVDLAGLGDADGDTGRYVAMSEFYSARMVDRQRELFDHLEASGVADRFVPVGLCSGAYMGLHAAIADSRVAAALLVNLFAFDWSQELVDERDRRKTAEVVRGGLLRRIRRTGISRSDVRRALGAYRSALRARGRGGIEDGQQAQIDSSLDALRESATDVLFLFSLEEPLHAQFERQGQLATLHRWPNVQVEQIPTPDHELRPLWIQAIVNHRLDRALDELRLTIPLA